MCKTRRSYSGLRKWVPLVLVLSYFYPKFILYRSRHFFRILEVLLSLGVIVETWGAHEGHRTNHGPRTISEVSINLSPLRSLSFSPSSLFLYLFFSWLGQKGVAPFYHTRNSYNRKTSVQVDGCHSKVNPWSLCSKVRNLVLGKESSTLNIYTRVSFETPSSVFYRSKGTKPIVAFTARTAPGKMYLRHSTSDQWYLTPLDVRYGSSQSFNLVNFLTINLNSKKRKVKTSESYTKV